LHVTEVDYIVVIIDVILVLSVFHRPTCRHLSTCTVTSRITDLLPCLGSSAAESVGVGK